VLHLYQISLIRGEGTGPELTEATLKVLEATGVEIKWDELMECSEAMDKYGIPMPEESLECIRKNKVALKGPLTTHFGTGYRGATNVIRQSLDMYANVRPVKTFKGANSKYENVDLVVIRENTEDLYVQIEHKIHDYAAESIKLITRPKSERIARYAFNYALENDRNRVTVIHKANVLKYTDGMFMQVAEEVSKEFPQIEFEDRTIDNICAQLVLKPENYDILLCPNQYGDILSDLTGALAGSLGLAPGANIGKDFALFEPIHGSAPKHAGMNKVNPTAMILAAAMMLKHLGEKKAAQIIEQAVEDVIAEGDAITYDIGGYAGTAEMGEAIASKVRALSDQKAIG